MKNYKVCAVIPAYNEERQIVKVLSGLSIDTAVVVDDGSSDQTALKVSRLAHNDASIVLLSHDRNQGVGGAIATGYKYARDCDFDIAVVIAGDGQMDQAELSKVLTPVVNGKADYAKGNRLIAEGSYRKYPLQVCKYYFIIPHKNCIWLLAYLR